VSNSVPRLVQNLQLRLRNLNLDYNALIVLVTWAAIPLVTIGMDTYVAHRHFPFHNQITELLDQLFSNSEKSGYNNSKILYAFVMGSLISLSALFSLLSLRYGLIKVKHDFYVITVHFSILVFWFVLSVFIGEDNIFLFIGEVLLAVTSGFLLSFTLSGATLSPEEKCTEFGRWFANDMSPKGYKIVCIRYEEKKYLFREIRPSLKMMKPSKEENRDDYMFVDSEGESISINQCMLVMEEKENRWMIQTHKTTDLPIDEKTTIRLFTNNVIYELSQNAFGIVLELEYHTRIVQDFSALSKPLFSMIDSKWTRKVGAVTLGIDVLSSGIISFLRGIDFKPGPLSNQFFQGSPPENFDLIEVQESAITTILRGVNIESEFKIQDKSSKSPSQPIGYIDLLLKFHFYLSVKLIRSMSPRNDTRIRAIIHHYGVMAVNMIHLLKIDDLLETILSYMIPDEEIEDDMDSLWSKVNEDSFSILTRFVVEPFTGLEDLEKMSDIQSKLIHGLTRRRSSYLKNAQSFMEQGSTIRYYHNRQNYLTKSTASALIVELLRQLLQGQDLNREVHSQ